MWTCGRRTASGVVAGVLAVTLAGCGGGSRSTAPAAKKLTIAAVCKQHETAVATIVSGLVDYKTYMTAADPAFRLTFAGSGIAEKVAPAISTLKQASAPIRRHGPGERFFSELAALEGWLRYPAAVPGALTGARNASKVEDAARAVGCPI